MYNYLNTKYSTRSNNKLLDRVGPTNSIVYSGKCYFQRQVVILQENIAYYIISILLQITGGNILIYRLTVFRYFFCIDLLNDNTLKLLILLNCQ